MHIHRSAAWVGTVINTSHQPTFSKSAGPVTHADMRDSLDSASMQICQVVPGPSQALAFAVEDRSAR